MNTGHLDGCAFGRTARCTCTYLTQWDDTPIRNGQGEDLSRTQAEIISASEYQRRQQPAPYPMEEKNYYPQVDQPGLKALTVNGEIWEPRQLRHDEQLRTWLRQARTWAYVYAGLSVFLAAAHIARTAWGF